MTVAEILKFKKNANVLFGIFLCIIICCKVGPLYLKQSYYRLHALRSLSSRNYQSLPRMEADTPISCWITGSTTLSTTLIFPPACVCGCLRYDYEYLKMEICILLPYLFWILTLAFKSLFPSGNRLHLVLMLRLVVLCFIFSSSVK